MKILSILILTTTFWACQSDGDEKANDDNALKDPDGRPCTLIGAVGSINIAVETNTAHPPYLTFKRGSETLATECLGTGTMSVDRNASQMSLNGYLPGQETPTSFEVDVFSRESCDVADENNQTLVKAGAIVNLTYNEETVYPNGRACGGQKVNNGSGTLSLD